MRPNIITYVSLWDSLLDLPIADDRLCSQSFLTDSRLRLGDAYAQPATVSEGTTRELRQGRQKCVGGRCACGAHADKLAGWRGCSSGADSPGRAQARRAH